MNNVFEGEKELLLKYISRLLSKNNLIIINLIVTFGIDDNIDSHIHRECKHRILNL